MGMEILSGAVVLLALFAVFDLMVGVSNDAVNFLNSSIGSRVATRRTIMIVASLGILAGVTFSSGMMEVARKGIFHPKYFVVGELITIFLAVMLTDIILLDMFNTFGLPTSTTVSIVFELLGGAVAVSLLKLRQSGESLLTVGQYINSGKALMIISGILLSVAVAFAMGAVVQFITRTVFTFDFTKRLRRYGALWGGVALSSITYFILVKGSKGASFLTPEAVIWIKTHTLGILIGILSVSAVFLQILLSFRVNILKPIILIGTFALAMAFAANDLVNFIGVPMAGFHAFKLASASSTPLVVSMAGLSKKVPTETVLLLLAGLVMVLTLWVSRKARSVTATEIGLSQQEEGEERFDSTFISRALVRIVLYIVEAIKSVTPRFLQRWLGTRYDASRYHASTDADNKPSFDHLRAAVNLMVASAVISYATSKKLPLSTTYVTFMVAMGTSFADLAWGRESAVYRVTGVLTVIGGWFMTALSAFTICSIVASLIFFAELPAVVLLVIIAGAIVFKTHKYHGKKSKEQERNGVFNLKKVKDVQDTVFSTFGQTSHLVREINESLKRALNGLYAQNAFALRNERRNIKKVQKWADIIVANIFKSMRLLESAGSGDATHKYAQTIRRVQKLADGHRDIVERAHQHVSNHHKGLLKVQIEQLKEIGSLMDETFLEVEKVLEKKQQLGSPSVLDKTRQMRTLANNLNHDQVKRIQSGSSKTRLSILFYAIVGNAMMLSKQNLKLLEIFEESFSQAKKETEFDLD